MCRNGMDINLFSQKTGICWVKSYPSDDSPSSQWNSNYLILSCALNNCYQHSITTCAFLLCFQDGREISWNQINFSQHCSFFQFFIQSHNEHSLFLML